ncbi:MAG: undecaprenyl-diphosphate phosphatase [Terracidiphilus sp.]
MSPYILSILLGIVEGLTEFLPVSSTAHLRIAEALMRIPLGESACGIGNASCLSDVAYWQMYTIVIQVGAILALCLLFLERIINFLRTFPRGENGDRNWLTHPISLMLIAFACTSVPALLLRKWSEKNLGSLNAIAIALLAGGVIMWAIDAWSTRVEAKTTHVEEMTLPQAIWIGLCQTLSAIFPGTSRSMSTIAAGQLAGLDRPAALEFSFLLSIPTMIAATGWDLIKETHAGKAAGAAGASAAHVVMNPERWGVLIVGTVVSFIVALGVVEWFLHWVRKHGFTVFAIYRILLGGALLIWGAKLVAG